MKSERDAFPPHECRSSSSRELGDHFAKHEPNDAHLEEQELVRELARALRNLPERAQVLLSLYHKEELSMREVSEVLEISEHRVRQLHARALSALREMIGDERGSDAA